jgi:hypothetical protein
MQRALERPQREREELVERQVRLVLLERERLERERLERERLEWGAGQLLMWLPWRSMMIQCDWVR